MTIKPNDSHHSICDNATSQRKDTLLWKEYLWSSLCNSWKVSLVHQTSPNLILVLNLMLNNSFVIQNGRETWTHETLSISYVIWSSYWALCCCLFLPSKRHFHFSLMLNIHYQNQMSNLYNNVKSTCHNF